MIQTAQLVLPTDQTASSLVLRSLHQKIPHLRSPFRYRKQQHMEEASIKETRIFSFRKKTSCPVLLSVHPKISHVGNCLPHHTARAWKSYFVCSSGKVSCHVLISGRPTSTIGELLLAIEKATSCVFIHIARPDRINNILLFLIKIPLLSSSILSFESVEESYFKLPACHCQCRQGG